MATLTNLKLKFYKRTDLGIPTDIDASISIDVYKGTNPNSPEGSVLWQTSFLVSTLNNDAYTEKSFDMNAEIETPLLIFVSPTEGPSLIPASYGYVSINDCYVAGESWGSVYWDISPYGTYTDLGIHLWCSITLDGNVLTVGPSALNDSLLTTVTETEPYLYDTSIRYAIRYSPATPEKAINPNPEDAGTYVNPDSGITLSWEDGGDGEANAATSYDVYAGTESGNLSIIAEGIEETEFETELLTPTITTFYWRVDSINDSGTTEGDEWSFEAGNVLKPYDLDRDDYNESVDLYDEFSFKNGGGAYWYDIYYKRTFFDTEWQLAYAGVADSGFNGAQGNVNTFIFPAGALVHGSKYTWKVIGFDYSYFDDSDEAEPFYTAESSDANFWTTNIVSSSSKTYGTGTDPDDPNTGGTLWGGGTTYRRNMMSCPRRLIAATQDGKIFYEDR